MHKYAFCLLLLSASAWAQPVEERYALILETPPLQSRAALADPAMQLRRHTLLKDQDQLRSALRSRKIVATGAVQTLLNAVFVAASADRVEELRALPGVAAVIPMEPMRRSLNKVVDAVNASTAWSVLGGASNAGAGIKIAVLDTGIDETHPGFKDDSLSMPSGYPKTGSAGDAAHATNKIIAVRSFVSRLAAGSAPEFSRPDDLSARDRVGHGTAIAMIAAGVSHNSPLGTISGIAPKAWLGNYKIFGSPGVLDFTTADVVLEALEAAFLDGMDVAILSAGNLSAMWAPEDRGSVCGNANGAICDPWTAAVTSAAIGGMTVVVPAGNNGAYGPNTIDTPGHVPGVITVGATTNARILASTALMPDGRRIPIRFGDGPKLTQALTAPLKMIAGIDATEHACLPLPAGSMTGAIALVARGDLVSRGNCSFAMKVKNAQNAGAAAVLIFREPGGSLPFAPSGLSNTGIPAALISAESALLLKSNPPATLTLDPIVSEVSGPSVESVAEFSGRGPGLSEAAIKPELVAPGAALYTAAQKYDPNGDLYSPDGYIGVDGTSFAAAVAGGAVALVKQAHPQYTPAQLKSAITNTAAELTGHRIVNSGAGKLNVAAALATTLTVEPGTAAFGVVKAGPVSKTLTIRNTGASAASLQFSATSTNVRATPSSLTLNPGTLGSVSIELTGPLTNPGSYEGFITITGGAVPVRIPYLYVVADGIPNSLVPLTGNEFVTEAGTAVQVAFKAIDRYGAPVASIPVRFAPSESIYAATPATDNKGIAEGYLYSSGAAGEQSFVAQLQGSAGIEFKGRTRIRPNIAENGVRDAASSQLPNGFAAGSYLTIYGAGLSEGASAFRTPYLPLSLAGVSVSFDAPSLGIQVPGRLAYVSEGQVNVQLPWELAGAGSAIMKVTLSNSASRNARSDNSRLGTFRTQLTTIPIASHSPAFFEYLDTSSGRMLAAALDEESRVIGSANPVRPGSVIQFFVNGLGEVTGTQPRSGEITPAAPLSPTKSTPVVTMGDLPTPVSFSGLAPLNVGLYQVNVTVPAGLPSGVQPVVLTIGGISAATSVIVQ